MAKPRRFPMVWRPNPHPPALSTRFYSLSMGQKVLPQAQIWLPYTWLSQRQFIWSFANSHLGVILFLTSVGTSTLYWISWFSNIPSPFSPLSLSTRCSLFQAHHAPLYLDVPCPSCQTSVYTSPSPGSFPGYSLLPQYSVLPLSWGQLHFCDWLIVCLLC